MTVGRPGFQTQTGMLLRTLPGDGRRILRLWHCGGKCQRERVRGQSCHGGSQAQDKGLLQASARCLRQQLDPLETGLPCGQGAGLVEADGIDAGERLDGIDVPHENAALGEAAGSGKKG